MILTNFTSDFPEPLSHNPNIIKHVLLRKGECANLTQMARSIFPPHEEVELHAHRDMVEIFMVRSGTGQIIINGQLHMLQKDVCVVVEPEEIHALINTGADNLVVDYFGLQI